MDLPGLSRAQLFKLVDSVQPRQRYKILVVDARAKRIINLACKTHDILDRNVANVVVLDEPRKTESYLDAVYIIEPSQYSIECLAADFTRAPPRYSAAHVFFLGVVPDQLALKLKNSAAGRFVAKLGSAPFDWLALERNVVSLGDPFGGDVFYNRHMDDALRTRAVEKMALQVVDLCGALGERPSVRFQANASGISERVAQQISSHLGNEQSGSQLIVVDRSVDPVAPLLHEFTFQAMAQDLLHFEQDGEFVAADESARGRLDDTDVDWVDLRHMHISQVVEELTARVAALKSANPHLANKDSNVGVQDIRNMMASLPGFVKSKDRMALNLQVAVECMDHVEKQELRLLVDAEQAALFGPSQEENAQSAADMLVERLAPASDTSRQDKLRLLAVYALSRQTGLYLKDYERLRMHANLDQRAMELVINAGCFGTTMVKSKNEEDSRKARKNAPHYYRENIESPFLYMRFTPGLKTVVSNLAANTLDAKQFPYAGEASDVETSAETAYSLRNPRQRATWAKGTSTQVSRPKIFVLMLGGITFSEMRSMYEAGHALSRDVVLIGSDVLTPKTYLTFLSRMGLPRQELGLPADAPKKQVPKFLFDSDRENKDRAVPVPSDVTSAVSSNGVLSSPEGLTKEKKKKRFFGIKRG